MRNDMVGINNLVSYGLIWTFFTFDSDAILTVRYRLFDIGTDSYETKVKF